VAAVAERDGRLGGGARAARCGRAGGADAHAGQAALPGRQPYRPGEEGRWLAPSRRLSLLARPPGAARLSCRFSPPNKFHLCVAE